MLFGAPLNWENAGNLQKVKCRWVTGINAGGCRNNMMKYSCNPQYPITITETDVLSNSEEDHDDGACSVLICLIQNYRRMDRKLGMSMNPIGIQIYKSFDPEKALTAEHFTLHAEVLDSGPYVAQRSINLRSKLAPGHYVIIPSTFAPDTEGAFMLRIFTDAAIQFHEGFNLEAEGMD
uniref:calpain clp-1-like isoform X2 n=1 Tax=Pristiophorus japonicus TaxID=55135 RepID=UPI00398E9DD9